MKKKFIALLLMMASILLTSCSQTTEPPPTSTPTSWPQATSSTELVSTATATIEPTPTIRPIRATPTAESNAPVSQRDPHQKVLYVFTSEAPMYGYTKATHSTSDFVFLFPDPPPGGWHEFEFAHFANRMFFTAYPRETLAEVWLMDMAGQDKTLVAQMEPPIATFQWSPDDLHLIANSDDEQPGLIYHLQTHSLEPWPFACDRVARSPKTDKLALWCVSTECPHTFAVIEWGGEVWISPEAPQTVIVKQPSNPPLNYPVWGWSMDGEKVAYFDREGSLWIYSGSGPATLIPVGKIDWDSEVDLRLLNPFDHFIEWSGDSSRLLVNTRGNETAPCPPTTVRGGDLQGTYPNPPCWHVIDVQTGKAIWKLSDFISQSTGQGSDNFMEASLSYSGRSLALASIYNSEREIAVLDVDSKQPVWLDRTVLPDALRWGDLPPEMSENLTEKTPTVSENGGTATNGGELIMASPEEAEAASQAGHVRWLNEVIKPDSSIVLNQNEAFLIRSGWCSGVEKGLQESISSLQVNFFINGEPIDSSLLATRYYTGADISKFCHGKFILITSWPLGVTTVEITYRDWGQGVAWPEFFAPTMSQLYTVRRVK